MTTPIRAVVAVDVAPAREELCFLLESVDGVTVVGRAENGPRALAMVGELTPHVVFLDVQMPGQTGFDVARALIEGRSAAHVVFVTAYDQYAVEAFEVNAVDYLLKPLERQRLEQAVERVRQRVAAGLPRDEQVDRLIQEIAGRRERRGQLAVRVDDRVLLVRAEDVVFASLDGDTVVVATEQVTGTSNYRTLDELQARLDPDVFWRVHRSHLVNIGKVKEIVPWFSRNYILRMRDGKSSEIPVSRSQTKRLRQYLKL